MFQEYSFEICVGSLFACKVAEEANANRVELCSALEIGGITPSAGLIAEARKVLTNTKLHVLIRPRGGDFCYSASEVKTMLSDIQQAKELGADGVVIGALNPSNTIDISTTKKLVQAASGLSITFHRAFDCLSDLVKGLYTLMDLGANRVLTSGGEASVELGKENLKQLHSIAENRIKILAGGGVSETNIKEIADYTGIREFHFSGRVQKKRAKEVVLPSNFDSFGFGSALLKEVSPERVHSIMCALKRDS